MRCQTEQVICATAVALMWLFFFVQALHTPTLLDDWYQLPWHRHHPLSVASVWDYAHYKYFNFNPRIGDVLLMLVNGPRWIHLVLTPLVQLAFLPLAFALALGRWPRLQLRDFALLFIFQTLIWLMIPIAGVIYFYRPFATNYLWPFVVVIALFVPYRLELARVEPGPREPGLRRSCWCSAGSPAWPTSTPARPRCLRWRCFWSSRGAGAVCARG